jgi:hypothetical protein
MRHSLSLRSIVERNSPSACSALLQSAKVDLLELLQSLQRALLLFENMRGVPIPTGGDHLADRLDLPAHRHQCAAKDLQPIGTSQQLALQLLDRIAPRLCLACSEQPVLQFLCGQRQCLNRSQDQCEQHAERQQPGAAGSGQPDHRSERRQCQHGDGDARPRSQGNWR